MSYTDTRSSAAATLARKGQTVTLTYPGGATYDPATATTSGSGSSETVKGVILPLGSVIRYAFKQQGGMVIEGDQELLLAGLNTAGTAIAQPKVGGTVTDSRSNVWTLVVADPLSPDGTDILYDCVIRRAA